MAHRKWVKVFLSIFFAYVAMGMAFFGREVGHSQNQRPLTV